MLHKNQTPISYTKSPRAKKIQAEIRRQMQAICSNNGTRLSEEEAQVLANFENYLDAEQFIQTPSSANATVNDQEIKACRKVAEKLLSIS